MDAIKRLGLLQESLDAKYAEVERLSQKFDSARAAKECLECDARAFDDVAALRLHVSAKRREIEDNEARIGSVRVANLVSEATLRRLGEDRFTPLLKVSHTRTHTHTLIHSHTHARTYFSRTPSATGCVGTAAET